MMTLSLVTLARPESGGLLFFLLFSFSMFLRHAACQLEPTINPASMNATAPSPTVFTQSMAPAPQPVPAPALQPVAAVFSIPAPAPAPAPANQQSISLGSSDMSPRPQPRPIPPVALPPVPPSSTCSSGCIAGIVVGAVVGIAFVAAVLYLLFIKRQRTLTSTQVKGNPARNGYATKYNGHAPAKKPSQNRAPATAAGSPPLLLNPGQRVCSRLATGGHPGYIAQSYSGGYHVPVRLDNGQQLLVPQADLAQLFSPNEKVLYLDPTGHGTRVATVVQVEGHHWPPFYSISFANEAGTLDTVQQQLQPLPRKTV